MDIIHVGTELAPVAKAGGLADVLLGLSRELLRKGHSVRLILPKYDCLLTEPIANLKLDTVLSTLWEGEDVEMEVWSGIVESLPVTFLRSRHPDGFFDRQTLYGCDDDPQRFLHFSRMVYDFLLQTDTNPDILHLHDWQGAALPLLFRQENRSFPKLFFTIHNLAYQGVTDPDALRAIGLSSVFFDIEDPNKKGKVNLMKGAILYSDYLNTVSPTYAKEILTPEGGKGLDEVLRTSEHKFVGILNGIDEQYWNPETDRYLSTHFSPRKEPLYNGDQALFFNKRILKNLLRQELGLEQSKKPLIASVSRLVPQKGIDLIKHGIETTRKQGGQFVLLGTTPIPSIFEEFQALQELYKNDPDIAIILRSPEELVHLIYAGADLFVVPSLFEPCGLTQLISLRYGTIPIVRETGGLSDTIFDLDFSQRPFEEVNGFSFKDPTPEAFEKAIQRAFHVWNDHPQHWEQLVIQAMQMDYSWKRSSQAYLQAYANLLSDQEQIA